MNSLDDLKQLVISGKLAEALSSAKKLVIKAPLDSGARSTLCALLFVSGEHARAVQQFEAYRQLGGENLLDGFADVLACYEKRGEVLIGKSSPVFPGEQPEWFETHLAALEALADSREDLLVQSLDSMSDTLLTLKGETEAIEFEGFRNGDMRLAPVFEGVFDGQYTWLPFEQIKQIILPARPELIQDFIAMPCMVAMTDGWRRQGHLFGAYPGTEISGSDKAKLSMETHWDEAFEKVDIGQGQQILIVGEDVVPLFSLGSCRFS